MPIVFALFAVVAVAFLSAGIVGAMDALAEPSERNRADYTDRMIGLYVADRELRAAAERVHADWLVQP